MLINPWVSQNHQDQQFKQESQTEFRFRSSSNLFLEKNLAQYLGISEKIDKEVQKELSYIFHNILHITSLEQAQIHSQANKLGMYDIKGMEITQDSEFCECCGFTKQEQTIPICTPFEKFPKIGISIYHFFETIKILLILFSFLLITFSIFGVLTNYSFSKQQFLHQPLTTKNIDQFAQQISLNSLIFTKQQNVEWIYLIEIWIGIGVIIIWSLILFLVKWKMKKYENMVMEETVNPSDFSILINNYPRTLSHEDLQDQLNEYKLNLPHQNEIVIPFIIEKLCLSDNLCPEEEEEKTLKDITKRIDLLERQIEESVKYFCQKGNFLDSQNIRMNKYHQIEKLKKNKQNLNKKIMQNSFVMSNLQLKRYEEHKGRRNIAIVTFKDTSAKQIILQHNTMTLTEKIRYFLGCCPQKHKLQLVDSTSQTPTIIDNTEIMKAPEPEDIIWDNLNSNHCEKLVWKIAIYTFTIILLGISLGSIYFLMLNDNKAQGNFYLNILIASSVTIINLLIGALIRFLTKFQKHYTKTGYQTSIAFKSILGEVINSIGIPVAATYLSPQSDRQLANTIFYISFVSCFITPIIFFLNPYHHLIRFMSFCARKMKSFRMSQGQLNKTQEFNEFEIGYQYIYYLKTYLFTSFFLFLQPIIAVFALFGSFFMYWIHKFILLNQSKRPVPGTDLINTLINQVINLGPVFFAFGFIVISQILSSELQKDMYIFYFVKLLILILSATFFIFPFSLFFQKCLKKEIIRNLTYEESRIQLTAEYDRMNPNTMASAIKQYKQYREEQSSRRRSKQSSYCEIDSIFQEGEFSRKNTIELKSVQSAGNRKRICLSLNKPSDLLTMEKMKQKMTNYSFKEQKKPQNNNQIDEIVIKKINKKQNVVKCQKGLKMKSLFNYVDPSQQRNKKSSRYSQKNNNRIWDQSCKKDRFKNSQTQISDIV